MPSSQRNIRPHHASSRAWRGFGAEQQDDQCANGQQSDAYRVSAQRDSREDQQGCDTASDSRHLRPCEEGVRNARQRADTSGDEDEVRAQREPLTQRHQLQRQEHGCTDDCGNVQAAD
jgi:hypothetical protein